MSAIEQWRAIPGWPEYEASTEGRVRRVAAAKGARRGRILKPWRNQPGGHLKIGLWRVNSLTREYVHRLVALAFHGFPVNPDHVVCHLDGDPSNNRPRNLLWATEAENAHHKTAHGTINRGTRNGQALLEPDDVRSIRVALAFGVQQDRLADAFGVSRGAISQIARRRTWAWLP